MQRAEILGAVLKIGALRSRRSGRCHSKRELHAIAVLFQQILPPCRMRCTLRLRFSRRAKREAVADRDERGATDEFCTHRRDADEKIAIAQRLILRHRDRADEQTGGRRRVRERLYVFALQMDADRNRLHRFRALSRTSASTFASTTLRPR
jgi:hypothetical protein